MSPIGKGIPDYKPGSIKKVRCPTCDGSGKINVEEQGLKNCKDCNGQGYMEGKVIRQRGI